MIGKKIHNFAQTLWGFNRSITGEGVRQTLEAIKELIPELEIRSIPSGKQVFDWQIPKEWKVREAYIICPEGKKICDFSKNNLHLVGYSRPFKGSISLDKLNEHLHSLPEKPDAIPYVTSYYGDSWGFCIEESKRRVLKEGIYSVVIDTELFDGFLNYGELILEGERKEEIFLSTYICHPSMANNELSGPTVTTFLAKWISSRARKYSYRIIFIPETIGSIAYLSQNLENLKKRVFSGFNVSCVGDNRAYSFLPSRNGNTISDKVAKHVLRNFDERYIEYTWLDRGSDERQYCSPGVDLPIASIMRSKFGTYEEYHTSLDNLIDVVTPEGLDGGYWALRRAIEVLEKDCRYMVNTLCEPMLGKRNLMSNISKLGTNVKTKQILDFITFCDGENSILDIANIIDVPFWELSESIDVLEEMKLIQKVEIENN